MSATHKWRCGACGVEQIQIVNSDEFEMHDRLMDLSNLLEKVQAERDELMEIVGIDEEDFARIRYARQLAEDLAKHAEEDSHAAA